MTPDVRIVIGTLCLVLWAPGYPLASAPGRASGSWAPDGPTRLLAQEVPEPAQSIQEPSDVGSRWTSYGMGIAIGAADFTAGALRQSADDRGVRLSLGVSPTVKRGAVGLALSGRVRF